MALKLSYVLCIQWKLDLADTDLAKNLDLKDTPQKMWATIFDFYYISPLEIAEKTRFSGQKFGDRFLLWIGLLFLACV